jgi:hypothetical protein
MEWRSIDVKPPSDGRYLAYGKYLLVGRAEHMIIARYYDSFWYDIGGNGVSNVTHWMPIPELPKKIECICQRVILGYNYCPYCGEKLK